MKSYLKGIAFYALACMICSTLAFAAPDKEQPNTLPISYLKDLKKERDQKVKTFQDIQEQGRGAQQRLQQLHEAGLKTVGQIEQLNAMIQKLENPSEMDKLEKAGVVPEKKK